MDGDRTQFHFSPRPNRAGEIGWREWGGDAFAEAQAAGKPILLGISAVWCHWCHVMDETSYSDDAVIRLINEKFVPVRVDNDQRPDVNARYNMGGWPTTAFLTPDGEVLAGMTYSPPEQLRDALEQVSRYYHENREEIARKVAEAVERRHEAIAGMGGSGDVTGQAVADVLSAIDDVYDPVHGGFGGEQKFPHTDALDLLLHMQARRSGPDLLHMARKTLERMAAGGIHDHVWGGFFRYATNRDWSVPHFEKMLEDNAALLRTFLRLYRTTRDERHAAVADGIITYLDTWLTDGGSGAFFGSQDADEEFYALDAEARAQRDAPYVDRTVYTSWNAQAASAYLDAARTLDRPALADRALRALAFVWECVRRPESGMYRYHDGEPHVLGLLGDQVHTALALLDAYEDTADRSLLGRAQELAALMEERFADSDGGGFYDTWYDHESLGRLDMRQKPLSENAACARFFLRLEQFTREERHRETAARTLAAFAGQEKSMGHFASLYARVVDLFLHPQAEIKLVGLADEVAGLRSAALALALPELSLQRLDPARDADLLAALSLPADSAPTAYACFGTFCSAPVRTPEELSAAVETMQAQARSTRPDEFTPAARADPETAV